MKNVSSFSKDIVNKLMQDDIILTFRYRLLIEKENNSQDEALKNIFENLIKDDPFRFDKYHLLMRE